MSERYHNLPLEDAEELYEAAPCGFLSTLLGGEIIRANRTMEAWSGYSRDVLLRKRFQDLLTVPGKIYYETHFAPLLRMQGFINEIALELVDAGGRRLPVLVNTVQKSDDGGTPLVNRITVFNASDRRRYENELLRARREAEHASQAKTDLLHVIGHDIRNPLMIIRAMVNRLEKPHSAAPPERTLRHLRAATQRLLDLTSNILDHGQLEAGTLALREDWFDPRALAQDTIDSQAAAAEEKDLPLELELDAKLPAKVYGDRVKLGQVLMNLVANAIKFTSEGSITLRIRVERILERQIDIDFAVADTGIGIEPDRVAQIFDDFRQAGTDIAVRFGGTGLGLAISRKILALYGSLMAVDSVPGRGSIFSFRVRLARKDEASG